MGTPADGKQFTDFFEAFCHRFDCPPSKFEQKAFFMAVPGWKKPIVWALFYITPDLFDIDLDIVEELGRTRTRDDFSGVLDEFHNAMRVNRSSLKTKFGMRMQGSRLMDIREELDALIAPSAGRRKPLNTPAAAAAAASAPKPAGEPPSQTRAAYVPTESRALQLRKLRQAHAAIISGTPLSQALNDNGFEEAQFLELLGAENTGNPSFAWLREQLSRDRRLRDAEAEVARLNRAVSDQSREIGELRDRLANTGR